ncbi:OmpH family outer membrane protein [Patescibacteria group bacterium]|nr:OmpH family outer membrane protein [Patescibacteria group bacterium]
MTENKIQQLKCKICETKRMLTEEEIAESIAIISKHSMKPDHILNIWSAFDGDACPDTGNHQYIWNPPFRENVLNIADTRKGKEVDFVRNTNENEELRKNYEKLQQEKDAAIEKLQQEKDKQMKEITESKDKQMKEIQDKIQKNEEVNAELVESNRQLEEEILKTSGRDWKGWL